MNRDFSTRMPTECTSDSFSEFMLNCSWIKLNQQKFPIEFAYPLCGFIAPFLIILTIVVNSFVVLVLTRSHMKTPTNFILMIMAIAEMCSVMGSLPWFLYYYSAMNYKLDDSGPGIPTYWCQLQEPTSEFVPLFFNATTIYLTLLLAVQRYIYVCHPTVAQHLCTEKRTKTAVVFVVFFITVFHLPKFCAFQSLSRQFEADEVAEFWVEHSNFSFNHNRRQFCVYDVSDWIRPYSNMFFAIWFWCSAVFVHVMPCMLLMFFTMILIVHIKRAEKRRRRSLMMSNQRSRSTFNPAANDTNEQSITAFDIFRKRSKMRDTALDTDKSIRFGSGMPNTGSRTTLRVVNSEQNSLEVPEVDAPAVCENRLTPNLLVATPQRNTYRPREVSVTSGIPFNKASRGRRYHQTTKMLIVIIFIMTVIELPAALVIIMHATSVIRSDEHYYYANGFLIIRNLLVILSYPLNFAIYCRMSEQFRRTVASILKNHKLTAQSSTTQRSVRKNTAIGGDVYKNNSMMNLKRTSVIPPGQMVTRASSLREKSPLADGIELDVIAKMSSTSMNGICLQPKVQFVSKESPILEEELDILMAASSYQCSKL